MTPASSPAEAIKSTYQRLVFVAFKIISFKFLFVFVFIDFSQHICILYTLYNAITFYIDVMEYPLNLKFAVNKRN